MFIAGDRIATASEDGTVRTWVSQLQPPLQLTRSIPAPHRTNDRRAKVEGSVVTLRMPWGVVTLEGHRDDVLSVEISRDNSRVVTASEDGDARLGTRERETRFGCFDATAALSSTLPSARTDASSSPAARGPRACGTR